MVDEKVWNEELYDGTGVHDYSVPPSCEVQHSETCDGMADVEGETIQESTSDERTSDIREHISMR